MKNYILFLYFSQIRQSVINKPKNIAALDTLNEPTILNGNNAITIGKVLNTHAQRGSPVAPETTATNNATEKANTPKKQHNTCPKQATSNRIFIIVKDISILRPFALSATLYHVNSENTNG